jgi:hypothetical protein
MTAARVFLALAVLMAATWLLFAWGGPGGARTTPERPILTGTPP